MSNPFDSGGSELSPLVDSKLRPGDVIVNCHEVSLTQGWLGMSRILALVSHSPNYALFVFNSNKFPPQNPDNIHLETTIPIDANFKFEINSECKQEEGTDVSVTVTNSDARLEFEMVPGTKTSNFVADIFRAVEDVNKNLNSQDQNWWSSYECSSTPAIPDDDFPDNMPLDDLDLPIRDGSARGPVVRENFIRLEMAKKEELYTYAQPFRVFVGTWNVNGQAASIGLSDWLSVDAEPPDIIAVGFQELDLSKEAFLFNDSPREAEWLAAVKKALHPGAQYQKVTLVRLVGMMLIVFVQTDLMQYVKNVAFDTVGTGIMGKLGNKGGVSIRMDIHNTSVCFVNTHLAAHVEEFERRNQDYRDIVSRTSFTRFLPPKHIKDHDQIYWLGDLNYRITDIDIRLVKEFIDAEDYSGLLQYDQLNTQHSAQRVFEGYTEGPIGFKPTYKYDVGTDNWDSSEKNRAPAWCDRILWKGDSVKQICYRSHPIMRISDHKPVSALFESQFLVVDQTKFRKVYEEVMKKLDKMENEGLPQVMVDTTEIIFDSLKFLEPQSRELIIANTGHNYVEYEFIKKLGDETYCKEWLRIEPCTGFITPGDKVDVKLEVYVDKKSAFKLNSGEYKLYDILVLHLNGGKDIFITVTGNYERSCFGYSLEMLLNITVPIKELPVGKLMELEKKKNGEVDSFVSGYTVPKEIWFLVDHLYRHGLKQPHLFEQPGLHSEIILIRNWLDYGSQESLPGSVHSVAEALLLLLESTAEPIFPYSIQQDCIAACSNYIQCKQIVHQLPETSRNVFIYLCIFLQELLSHSSENHLDTKTIASLFGGIFIRESPKSKTQTKPPWTRTAQQLLDRKKAHFVYHFLVNDTSDLVSLSS